MRISEKMHDGALLIVGVGGIVGVGVGCGVVVAGVLVVGAISS